MKNKGLVDCHVHCNLSDDSTMVPDNGVKKAIELGLQGITFTDHYDIDYPSDRFRMKFDPVEHADCIARLRDQYGCNINIFNGIEIGIQSHVIEQSLEIVQTGFDCVICSVHAVDGYCLPEKLGIYKGKTKEQAYRRYLEAIYDTIYHFTDFDIVGHIGYIRRYAPYQDNSMHYEQYSDILDMILKKVIELNKAIEINTSGYAYNLGTPIPDIDLFKRYKDLGGSLVTLGSDGHEVGHIAAHFDQAVQMLKDAGFDRVVYYHERKPHLLPL